MMNKLDIFDNYLQGRLTDDEKELVEKRLGNDPLFAKELAEHKRVVDLIKVHEDNRLRRKFAELDKKIANEGRFSRTITIRMLSAAAAIALLVVSYIMFVDTGNDIDNNNLALTLPLVHEYMDPPANYFLQRSRGRSVETKASDAMLLYDAGQYQQAALIFDELLPEQDENPNLLFFGGVSYLMSNQIEKALDCFIRTEKLDHLFEHELIWYKSLIYLETGDKEKGKELLRQIMVSDSRFQQKAEKIYKNID